MEFMSGWVLPLLAEIPFPQIDPVLVSIGPIPIRWYSLSYIAGLILGYVWVRANLKHTRTVEMRAMDDLFLWIIIGVVFGGRIGSVLFYGFQQDPQRYFSDPMAWLAVWDGGMSFHGGFLGVLLAVVIWSRFNRKTRFLGSHGPAGHLSAHRPVLWQDCKLHQRRAVRAPDGRAMGNAVSNLWPNGVKDQWTEPRHPSQLYESFLEGLVLLIVLNVDVAEPGDPGPSRHRHRGLYGWIRLFPLFGRVRAQAGQWHRSGFLQVRRSGSLYHGAGVVISNDHCGRRADAVAPESNPCGDTGAMTEQTPLTVAAEKLKFRPPAR